MSSVVGSVKDKVYFIKYEIIVKIKIKKCDITISGVNLIMEYLSS